MGVDQPTSLPGDAKATSAHLRTPPSRLDQAEPRPASSPARGTPTAATGGASATSAAGGPTTTWHSGHHAAVRQDLLPVATRRGPDRSISATAGGRQGATADHEDLEQSTEIHGVLPASAGGSAGRHRPPAVLRTARCEGSRGQAAPWQSPDRACTSRRSPGDRLRPVATPCFLSLTVAALGLGPGAAARAPDLPHRPGHRPVAPLPERRRPAPSGLVGRHRRRGLSPLQARLAREFPAQVGEVDHTAVFPLREQLFGAAQPQVMVLLAVTALLACLGWGNARTSSSPATRRTHELAVRLVLGASRRSLWLLFLREAAFIAVAADVLAMALAAWATPLVVAASPQAAGLPLPEPSVRAHIRRLAAAPHRRRGRRGVDRRPARLGGGPGRRPPPRVGVGAGHSYARWWPREGTHASCSRAAS